MHRLQAAALLLVAGCSSIDVNNRVDGWPELRVIEHRVSHQEMRARCDKYVAWGMIPAACSEFNLSAGVCHIWLDEGFAPAFIVEHERLHCTGHDHVGSSHMADMFARWKAAR